MDNKEAMYWVAVMRQANQGDREAQELLIQTDEARKENGLPSVREELRLLTTTHPRMKAKPDKKVSDLDTMDEDKLREVLSNARVIWRRPKK